MPFNTSSFVPFWGHSLIAASTDCLHVGRTTAKEKSMHTNVHFSKTDVL